MKRCLCMVLVLCVLLVGCSENDDVIRSLGDYEERVSYTYGEFQDYTDYAKYYYTDASVENNEYFKQITETSQTELTALLDDYENIVEVHRENDPEHELVVHYDFDRTMIDFEDYLYIFSETTTWPDGYSAITNYDIYFFDTQTQVLYFFHNNI